jgi:hypothetical protein
MHNELNDHSADEDNEEFVRRTIIWDDGFSFQADPDVTVMREDRMKKILDAIEDENERDTPLMFRQFVRELLAKVCLKLLGAINYDDILLQNVLASISQGELLDRYLFDNMLRSRGTQARCHLIQ